MFSMLLYLFSCASSQKVNPSEMAQPPTPNTSLDPAPKVESATPVNTSLLLDGLEITVVWDDGDTFSYVDSSQKRVRARLNGYNTLESYGPVHQWGDWTADELYALAKEAGTFASAQKWNCQDTRQGGGYGRILVDCPDLRDAILRAGLAHPFSVDAAAPKSDLEAMSFAISEKVGMWEKGAPNKLITSLHSQDEDPEKKPYNRICILENGICEVENHEDTYSVCQNVCLYDSCMIYVPYKQRYGENLADCLR